MHPVLVAAGIPACRRAGLPSPADKTLRKPKRIEILASFGPGDFFGDIALLDHGPRSADVIANVDSTLLRLSAAAFERLAKEAPSLATPFLQATSRTLASRIRADNKRLGLMTQQFSASGR